jgi:hypothetical protein
MVEVNIGIWCASIPALKALIAPRSGLGTENARSRAYEYHSRDRSAGAGKKLEESLSGGSRGVSVRLESFDLVMDDAGKVVKVKKEIVEQTPEQAAGRKQSKDSEWSVESADRIYQPGADSTV